MPASTMDPIASALKHAFQGKNVSSSSSSSSSSVLENGLVSSAKKTLLSTTVAFDAPVRHFGGALKKSTYIFLNPKKSKEENGQEPKKTNGEVVANGKSPAPPAPKVVFYRSGLVEVGYRSVRAAGAGMFNMGNTCYLNSTLQALFHTPAFYNYLMSGGHQRQCKAGGSCIICAMTVTLRDTLSSHVTRPNRVYEKLKLICKHLVHGRQEDAHEFLRYLIEALQRSFLQSCQAPKSLDNASKETTPFNQIFGGYMRQDVTCLKCKYVSITFQHFMDLLLDIRQASTVDDALNFYFRAERIGSPDGGNMYKCEKCKTKVPAKKKSFICRPPIVLCIQLKRFSIMGNKISKPVQLSRRLNVSQFVKGNGEARPPLQYKLVSMITHVGPSPNCGHYTAIGEAANGQFFQFDDSSVRPISPMQALNTASYVVIYEMTRESKQAWTSEPSSTSNKPCTVTSSPAPSPSPNGVRHNNTNQPKLIPSDKVSNSSAVNGLGVVNNGRASGPNKPQQISSRTSLVPYNEDSSDSDEDEKESRKQHNGLPKISNGSSFVPRAVTMNALKRSQEPRPSTPSPQLPLNGASLPRPSSAASSLSSEMTSSSGVWKVTDTDHHTPSVHSDNSTGSTSGTWRVTPTPPSVEPVKIVSEPFRPPPSTSTASSSLASTPERRIKRGSSMEEYEADLDRGRTKKVKKKHEDSRPSFNSSTHNPFQNAQNRGDSNYQRSSSANGWGHRGSHTWGGYQNHHRDHSYHAGGGGGDYNRQHQGGGGGGFHRRSYSSSSLKNEHFRDRHRHKDGNKRFHHQGGGRGNNGGAYRDYSRQQHHNRFKR